MMRAPAPELFTYAAGVSKTPVTLARIEAFVLRARRVGEHSMARDPQVLRDLLGSHMQLEQQTDGSFTIRYSVPPEEPMESLAARVRPMLLQKDPVYWGNVTADLGFYMKNMPADAELRRVLKTVRRDWAATEAGTSSLFRMEMSDSKSAHKSVVSDADLATSWLYGDLVHADEEARAIGDGYDIWQRYEAAVHQTARLAVLTLATLKLVLVAEAEGLFQLSPSVLEADVIVKELVREHANVQVFVAPEDTDMPEEFTELGPEWTRLEPGRSPA